MFYKITPAGAKRLELPENTVIRYDRTINPNFWEPYIIPNGLAELTPDEQSFFFLLPSIAKRNNNVFGIAASRVVDYPTKKAVKQYIATLKDCHNQRMVEEIIGSKAFNLLKQIKCEKTEVR